MYENTSAPTWAKDIDFEAFRRDVETITVRANCLSAIDIVSNIPIYDGANVTVEKGREWANILLNGAGVFVIKRAFPDVSAIDNASDIFREIIAEERAAGVAAGDHFAKAGANDRIWNSLQKLCLKAPEVYTRYMSNPVIDLACRSWLGPGYQMATQVNQVRPGGKAQQPHRDYHLGFMKAEQMADYPPHIHRFSPMLILQGGVAHCDAPIESGPTKLLPHSQRFEQGYMAALLPNFREYFEAHYVQMPLEKGDAIFFSPALFHAAGENRSADIARMVNLLQVASPFAKHMESLDRTAMSCAIFPYLKSLAPDALRAIIAATADGYPFPTNLDKDPPLGGMAPPSQQALLHKAVAENWTAHQLDQALSKQQVRRLA
jgi:ectoine hydroxylase-related dioxygenase (phytanoyl-CoA dioxygenase family)